MRVLYYHRVLRTEPASIFDRLNGISVRAMEDHAAELARHWHVLGVDEVRAGLDGGRFPRRAVHLTFDDGFADNLIAAEIFERHRLPWTLFVVSGAVLDGYRPWYLRLADALASAAGDGAGDSAIKARIKEEVMAAPAASHLDVLDRLLAGAGLSVPEVTTAPYLDTAALRELHGRGVTIGNHSASHANLARCTAEELDREVAQSKQALEAALGDPVTTFSYPDGRHDAAVRAAVGAAGHDLAFATWDSGRRRDRLAIRRVSAGTDLASLRRVLAGDYPIRRRARRVRRAARQLARRTA